MTDCLRQIKVEAVELPKDVPGQGHIQEAKDTRIDWLIDSGTAALVTGGRGRERSLLLRLFAGFKPPAAGQIGFIVQSGRKYPSAESGKIRVGYLPPPGEEAFVGTTVEQELGYCLPEKKLESHRLTRLEERFGVSFSSAARRSVWALSDSERRLLVLASQALASPDVWFCDEPLAMLDGKHADAVFNFLVEETRRGITVLAAAAEPGRLLDWAERIFIFSEKGGVLFQGRTDSLPEEVARELDWYHPLARKLSAAAVKESGKSLAGLLRKERFGSVDN